MKRKTVRYEGAEARVVMQSKVVSASGICRASGAEGVHSLQVPRQTHQTPFAPRAGQSAQQELPEFHDVLDQSKDRLNRAFAQRIQLAPTPVRNGLVLLVLIFDYCVMREIARAIGPKKLRELFFGPPAAAVV